MVPFMSLSFYTGPAAAALGGADIAFAVGLLVTGVIYARLCRTLDLNAEQRLLAANDRQLEEATR